jgi:hypothetical protein
MTLVTYLFFDGTTESNTIIDSLEKIPVEYRIGLKIVSESGKNGIAYYTLTQMGGGTAAAYGGQDYIDVRFPPNANDITAVLCHEIGHTLEQRATNTHPVLQWWADAMIEDDIEVSYYANVTMKSAAEDQAEFALIFATCLKSPALLNMLKEMSPRRFNLWSFIMVQAENNTALPGNRVGYDDLSVNRTISHGGISGFANVEVTGTLTATSFSGNGASITNLNASNLEGTVNVDQLPATVFRSGAAVSGDLRFTDANGRGIKFWDSEQYKIYMSAVDDQTWGGRMDSTSDFNMYFRMAEGTNRGFVFQSNQTNVAHIDGGGNLYIAGTLEASGEVTSYASDARLKTNINPIQDPLTIIEHLDGYTFQWRSDVEGLPMAGKKDIGLIVQDIDKAGLSEECTAPAPFDNTYKTIHYNKIHAISVASIKKLHQRINTLEQKVEFLLSKV